MHRSLIDPDEYRAILDGLRAQLEHERRLSAEARARAAVARHRIGHVARRHQAAMR